MYSRKRDAWRAINNFQVKHFATIPKGFRFVVYPMNGEFQVDGFQD